MSLKDWLVKRFVEKEGKKISAKLEGKKTYLVMGVTAVLGAIDAYNQHCVGTGSCTSYEVPAIAYTVLASLGIYTRAIAKPK